MLTLVIALLLGLVVLIFSADKFVLGAANVARHYKMSPLLIGMLIIGFGTSAPEILISFMSALDGKPALALGNAYGSNIANIALILGVTALISPIAVHSSIVRKEIPILLGITALSIALIIDFKLSRVDGIILLAAFIVLMIWTVKTSKSSPQDELGQEVNQDLGDSPLPLGKALLFLLGGLIFLLISSRMMVYGAVGIAQIWGLDELVIGLTVVAIGTSLPELASSVTAALKGEPDLALGNVLGSNLFNTLAVVGISASIAEIDISTVVLYRDVSVMVGLSLALFVFAFGFRGQGRINRIEGTLFLSCFVAYTAYLVMVSV
ncbi:calcium/sodium antiporter [Pseudobacteriovorax antillogorgiicola]|uniref:Cation:H+ antiporter n=1 Tax=Pseudobacteriovorax antillogorgiicola TaxID=1513793 RepID=A0A1Y6BNG9_9BACT|nr:calcium/sodium antiporter [Pseudobacteriovorax antillogorgiicola]TCS54652.1 cation:H+ antiporter [Pseudobacteriovorax antillogorgiicola]SMF16881.1 cation:H+ antiporter [Pseudobacteriovorax antillogorgiicola]